MLCLATSGFGQQKQPVDYLKISNHLEKIFDTDQDWRKKDIELSSKPGFDPNAREVIALRDSFARADSINLHRVDSILKNYGWLDTAIISKKANLAIFLVVQHANLEYKISIWPMIRKAYKSGALLPKDYALIYDRIQVYKGKKQLYGSQTKNFNGRQYIAPVKRKRRLNQRRKKMGLRPIEEYIKSLEETYKTKIYGIK